MKAHDVFPAICYPDLFWRMAEQDLNQTWYLMCPHAVSYTHLGKLDGGTDGELVSPVDAGGSAL